MWGDNANHCTTVTLAVSLWTVVSHLELTGLVAKPAQINTAYIEQTEHKKRATYINLPVLHLEDSCWWWCWGRWWRWWWWWWKIVACLLFSVSTAEAEWKWQEKRTRNTQVNTGCIANILMSLFLISAKGKMPVINKWASCQPMRPVLNNWFCPVLQLTTTRNLEGWGVF